MEIRWNKEKNILLKKERGICFDDVMVAIHEGRIVDIVEHHNKEKYPNQKILIVEIGSYAYLVPFVIDGDGIFLKTVIPSRKATKKYLRRKS